MTVRRATPADADAIVAIERASFAVPWSEASVRHDLETNPDARVWVAEEAGRVVGYAGLWRVLDEGQVNDVAVLPDVRRRGIGRALVRRMARDAADEGIVRLTLEVRSRNTAAIALYEAEGFGREGRRKGYYADDGDDAVLMGRSL